jgi:hypothetical protein
MSLPRVATASDVWGDLACPKAQFAFGRFPKRKVAAPGVRPPAVIPGPANPLYGYAGRPELLLDPPGLVAPVPDGGLDGDHAFQAFDPGPSLDLGRPAGASRDAGRPAGKAGTVVVGDLACAQVVGMLPPAVSSRVSGGAGERGGRGGGIAGGDRDRRDFLLEPGLGGQLAVARGCMPEV